MANGLIKLQNENGYWPASLSDDASIHATEKGWAAIALAVDNDGRVNWVQQVGKAPDPVSPQDTQLYGVGAVLLTASEMTKW